MPTTRTRPTPSSSTSSDAARGTTARSSTDPARSNYQPLVESWYRALRAAARSPLTILSYDNATSQLHAFLATQGMPTDVEHISREHVELFIDSLQMAGKSEATVAQRFRSLRAWFSWMAQEDHITRSPMARMRQPHVTDRPVPVLTDDEITRLLHTCNGRGFTDRRDTSLVSMFFTSGLRLAEMTGIEMHDLDLANRHVTVTGKGGRQRQASYSHDAASDLDRYLILRDRHPHAASDALWLGQDGPLTSSGIAQALGRRAEKAGISFHPHQLRHTFASNYLNNGGPEQNLLELAGWSSPRMLLRYGRATRAARAANSYDTFAPRIKR
jgi:site-specific recombinase XerC